MIEVLDRCKISLASCMLAKTLLYAATKIHEDKLGGLFTKS